MRQLNKQIIVDQHFQKSVNLNLDLGDVKRLRSYITTSSSVMILKWYLKNILGESKENATILIGPYGKGKSHLLLVLLAILQGEQEKISEILVKIKKTDMETFDFIQTIYKQKQRFLPVLVSGSGKDLNHSFVYALKEALEREGLEEIVPKSNYSEAIKVLEQWKQEYPQVYRQWQEYLEEKKETSKNIKTRLDKMDEGAMEIFLEAYPKLTAGSKFFPMVYAEALKIYQEVNRVICEKYGYSGIILIFDEFSKYIEGHGRENFARDMKVLQDLCELANRNGEQKLYLILVAHKSIHEYEKGIDKTVKNAFQGVEGRLKEVPFIVTARNHYELIADTLKKKEPEFSTLLSKYKKQMGYERMIEHSYQLPCFSKLFPEYKHYIQVMEKGCFPLTPVCAYILLHISEKAAQNERTIFTFLTSKEQGSLSRSLEVSEEFFVGVDVVYDYFKNLFRANKDQPKIHNEWLKAEYALKRTTEIMEKKIIKAIALIRMIHREDELPAQDTSIRLALGIKEETYCLAIQHLKQQEIVMFRKSLGTYAFKNNIGVDIEKEITSEIAKQSVRFPVCKYLSQFSEFDYILPKQHNQKRNMTRYFQYEFMLEEEFLQLNTTSYLFEERFADGKILALVCEKTINQEAIKQKVEELKDDRIVVLIPKVLFYKKNSLKRLAAINALKSQASFIEENKVLLKELELYEEDLVFEINVFLEREYLPGNGGCLVCYKEKGFFSFETDMEFNRFLSEICENYYQFSPKVNHELLNIQHVSGQYLRARNKVVAALLKEHMQEYQKGTAPECMVYRAAFIRTGILDKNYEKDFGCSRILEEIDKFFISCIGNRTSFQSLYQKLQGKDYGVRKGILPLFIAQRLSLVEGIPVIYLQQKELEVDENILNNVNEFPENYELYIEPESGKKEQYLKVLEKIWQISLEPYFTRQNRWIQITNSMQKWYRSLPQYTMVTKNFNNGEQKKIQSFRKLLKRAELNPREFLFERLPEIMKMNSQKSDLKETATELLHIKTCMDQAFYKLQIWMIEKMREIFGEKKNESLKGCLLSWYQKQRDSVNSYILTTSSYKFLKYLECLSTNDELEMVSQLSKIVLDIYMEDWRDDIPEIFQRELKRMKEEIEHLSENTEDRQKNMIILRDAYGHDIKRSYTADLEDTTSGFLKNMIDEAIEEFGETLELNQKVAVLVEVLQRLLL